MTSVMLDLETLSTAPNAAVLSIGLVAFNQTEVIDSLGIRLDPKEVFGHIDLNTVRWWMKQDPVAQAYSFDGDTKLFHAGILVKGFFEKHKPEEVWANSPSFDCVIFNAWWEGLKERGKVPRGLQPLWTYHQERDYRTYMREAEALEIPVRALIGQFMGTGHNPVDDAANQARAVIAVRKYLREVTRPPVFISETQFHPPMPAPQQGEMWQQNTAPQPLVIPSVPPGAGTITC